MKGCEKDAMSVLAPLAMALQCVGFWCCGEEHLGLIFTVQRAAEKRLSEAKPEFLI